MTNILNPKLVGSSIIDCKPQIGLCPIGCNQCYYNRSGAFYFDINKSIMPSLDDVGDKIVRVNSGLDSNIGHDEVILATEKYLKRFFNTSIPKFDFPAPVVYTANPREEEPANLVDPPNNLMFVRLRTSATNLGHIDTAVSYYTDRQVPVVLTFMSYYTAEPHVSARLFEAIGPCYEWRVRHINSYWCPTKNFMRWVMSSYASNRLISMCGSVESSYCKDCRNCETYYLQTMKRMRGE